MAAANIEKRIRKFAKSATALHQEKNVFCTVSRADIVAINKTIEQKIEQNKQERIASMFAAANCIVGR